MSEEKDAKKTVKSKGSDEEADASEATTSKDSKKFAASGSGGNKEKKGKILRFALPEPTPAAEDADHFERRSLPREKSQNSVGVRFAPLPLSAPRRVSDIMQAMQGDLTEDESGSSLYWDTEDRVIQPTTYVYKSLFDALKRSPTKSQADYHLLMSAHLRNLEGVVQALENGANVNVVEDQKTPLMIATGNNDKPLVKFLITVKDIDLDVKNIYGNSALIVALMNGFDEIATILVENKAQLNLRNNLNRTALHEALFRENYEMVKLLIQYHHDLEAKDCFGEKPIYTCSVKKPNLKILNYLLNAGASCEYENESGLNLLSRAILHSTSYYVIKRLISAGADINHQGHFCNRTPLHMAAIVDSTVIAKLLIQRGADPGVKTISGFTAFDLALYYKCFDTAEYLAPFTKNSTVDTENFNISLLSRLSKHGPAMFSLKLNPALPSSSSRNS